MLPEMSYTDTGNGDTAISERHGNTLEVSITYPEVWKYILMARNSSNTKRASLWCSSFIFLIYSYHYWFVFEK